jgi:hypothetical protein
MKLTEEQIKRGHHIWCNFWTRPLEDCPQCYPKEGKGAWELYPVGEGESEVDILKKYFPEVYEMNKDRIGEKE